MSQTSSTRASDTILPPTLPAVSNVAGSNTNVLNLSTNNAAQAVYLGSIQPAIANSPSGAKFYVTISVITTDVYLAFKLGNAAASINTATGFYCPAGGQYNYWIPPNVVNSMEYITSSGTGSIQLYISSPPYEGT